MGNTPLKGFVLNKKDLDPSKLFVEFYLPEERTLLERMRHGNIPVSELGRLSPRIFDGPFGSDRTIDMYQESGIPYIRVKDVRPEGIDTSGLTYISDEKHKAFRRSKVVPGDVLMTIAGRVGTAAVFPSCFAEGNITGHIVGIELPLEQVNPEYVAAFLNSRFASFQIARLSHRTTRPELNLHEARQILIPQPPRSVQDRIAQIMRDAYRVRSDKRAEAAALLSGIDEFVLGELGIDFSEAERHRTSITSARSLIRGRLDFASVVTLRDLDFGNIPSLHLSKIARPVQERITPARDCPEDDVCYVGLDNIASNTGELRRFEPRVGSSVLSSSPTFIKGDVLFGRMRPYLNKVWLAEFDGVCSGEAIVLRVDATRVDPRLLHALLLSRITLSQIIPQQSGTSLPRVGAADLLDITLPIPNDITWQRAIGDEVERRRLSARQLQTEAERSVGLAQGQIEQLILHGRDGDGPKEAVLPPL